MGMSTDGLSYWQAESEGIELLETTLGDMLDSRADEIPAQEHFDIRRGPIATAQPDHFWRRPAQSSGVRVIGVQRGGAWIDGAGFAKG